MSKTKIKTPFERKGWKPNDVFVVMETVGIYFKEGDIAVLFEDDGSDSPSFNVGDYFGKTRNRNDWYIKLTRLRKIGTL